MTDTIRIAKPRELVEVAEPVATLFGLLRDWFNVPEEYRFSLLSIDEPVTAIRNPVGVTAFAMRKLQALRYVATGGVETASDVVIALVVELERALEETPALLALIGGSEPSPEARAEFRRCVQAVHLASIVRPAA